MITPFQIYLMSLADALFDALVILTVISAAITFLMAIEPDLKYMSKHDSDKEKEDKDSHNKKITTSFIKSFVCFFLFALAAVLMPSTKTLVAMYVVPRVVNNTSVQKMPEAVLRFVERYASKE